MTAPPGQPMIQSWWIRVRTTGAQSVAMAPQAQLAYCSIVPTSLPRSLSTTTLNTRSWWHQSILLCIPTVSSLTFSQTSLNSKHIHDSIALCTSHILVQYPLFILSFPIVSTPSVQMVYFSFRINSPQSHTIPLLGYPFFTLCPFWNHATISLHTSHTWLRPNLMMLLSHQPTCIGIQPSINSINYSVTQRIHSCWLSAIKPILVILGFIPWTPEIALVWR